MKSITSAILFATFFTAFSMHFTDTGDDGKTLALVSMLLAATTLGMTIYFLRKGK